MDISAQDRRRAFSQWMRTGIWHGAFDAGGIEHKFNPYHDPRNGQFTFAPGGPRSLSHVVISHGRGKGFRTYRSSMTGSAAVRSPATDAQSAKLGDGRGPDLAGRVLGRGETARLLAPPDTGRSSRRGGSNRHYEEERHGPGDPDALERAFPGLRGSPAGAIVAVADGLFDLSGPSRAATTALARNWSNALENDIKRIVPGFRYDAQFENTLQGQTNRLNDLRWLRAWNYMRVKSDYGPLQVEVLRFMQASADEAYEEGMKLLHAGRLDVRLSKQEALGNYIDKVVRDRIRERFDRYKIEHNAGGPVRVNRREDEMSTSESRYRRPDARVDRVAFDVSLTAKNLATPQIQGFFRAKFQPERVIIVRPRQSGGVYTYIINHPGVR